jgi:4-hydroxyphenylpyruvate dioxygenase-like putative hemolysin
MPLSKPLNKELLTSKINKMRYLFLFLPLFSFAQDVVKDTVYIQKQGNIYYIIQQTTLSDSTVTGSKQILGDSATAIESLVTDAERQSNTLAIHAKPIITKGKSVQRINYYNDLHVQISGKPVYFTTAQRDTAKFVGDWKLNFNGEIIDGVIQLNSNKRLIQTMARCTRFQPTFFYPHLPIKFPLPLTVLGTTCTNTLMANLQRWMGM